MTVNLPIFPTLAGQGWSVKKTPRFKVRKQESISGRQLRILDQVIPIWSFELTFNFLRDKNDKRQSLGPGVGLDELRALAGFFLQRQGSFSTFWFDDVSDDTVVGQQIGIGDGTTTSFQLIRTFGGFSEPIIAPDTTSGRTQRIYLNGVFQSSGVGIDNATGLVSFVTPPGNTVVITADFSYYFLCHFVEDMEEFENFMFQLWEKKMLKFESTLL